RQSLERQLAVLGARRDDHRTRAHHVARGELHGEGPLLAEQLHGRAGDRHAGAELLRLRERATRQRPARDARRESEVVLDLGAGARLAAGCVGLEHEDVETLGCAVHGGRQPRGPGADHQEIAHDADVDGSVVTEALGKLLQRWVAEHHLAPADHHRDLVDADPELLEELSGVGVLLDVNVLVRVDVAGQELAHGERAGRVPRTDHHDVAQAFPDEDHAPQDEGADEQLAQLRISLDERAQRLDWKLEDLAVLDGPPAGQAAPAGEQADLAGELPGAMHDDHIFLALVGPNDLHGAREDNVEGHVFRALLEEDLAAAHAPPGAETCDAGYLIRRQPGEGGLGALDPELRRGHGWLY